MLFNTRERIFQYFVIKRIFNTNISGSYETNGMEVHDMNII